jgi:serine/threonine protein kinase
MIEPGQIVDGRFEVLELLGEGGLAHVYKVRHVALGSIHALKLLSWRKKRLAERLLLEGRIQAQLQHPNIVAVTDIVRHDGQFGLLMEYVPNESLEAFLVARGGLGLEEGLSLFAPILAAVTAAHDAGVLHRDLKPANVLLANSARGMKPKVTDFGIAKVVAEMADDGGTAVGSTMGTPGYLAPEQVLDSSTIDARADVFALGAIAWEIIVGTRAFADENGRVSVGSTTQITPPPVSRYALGVPVHVDEALARAMARDPADRFNDCRSFARALYLHRPELLADVDDQVSTGLLSLSGVREEVERSFSGGVVQVARPTTTTLAPPPTEPGPGPGPGPVRASEVRRPESSPVLRYVGWIALAALLLGVPVAIVGGVAVGTMSDVSSDVIDATPPPVPPSIPVPSPGVSPAPATAPVGPDLSTIVEPAVAEPAVESPRPIVPVPVAVADPGVPTPVPPEPVGVAVEPVPGDVPPVPVPAVAEPAAPVPTSVVDAPRPSEPVPTPAPSRPDVAGSWAGTANKLPFSLQIQVDQATGAVTGRVVFAGFQAREESFTGTLGADGALRFQAADLTFTGVATPSRLSGTYETSRGKPLVWDVRR